MQHRPPWQDVDPSRQQGALASHFSLVSRQMFVRQRPLRHSKPGQHSVVALQARQQRPLMQALPLQQSRFPLHVPPAEGQQLVLSKSNEVRQSAWPSFWQHWLLAGSHDCRSPRHPWQ
ncbi:MAG: hypothetical protein IT338_00390 [Thermomicrobiales bacterium]|nr:hypothetical protein [Thermomicrobiales bacterium]